MARKVNTYKQKSVVSGMTIQDVMNMDANTLNRLNEKELRQVVSRLVSASNKRLRRLEKTGNTSSPSYVNVKRTDGDFSTRGKNINQLRAEYVRARNFLNSKTSTVTGYKKFNKEFKKKTGVEYAEFFKDPTKARLMDRLREIDPNFENVKYGNAYQQINELINQGANIDEAWQELQETVTRGYEERERALLEQFFTNV